MDFVHWLTAFFKSLVSTLVAAIPVPPTIHPAGALPGVFDPTCADPTAMTTTHLSGSGGDNSGFGSNHTHSTTSGRYTGATPTMAGTLA